MRIDEMKGRINAMQHAQKSLASNREPGVIKLTSRCKVMTVQLHNQSKTTTSSYFSELTQKPTYGHTIPVGENHQQTARFWDSYPLIWRQTRHDEAAGFFMPVEFAHSGFMPGMRGLQNGVNRNKRVVFQVSDRITRQILPNPKIQFGAVNMTAITTGAPAHNPLARLPHIPFAPAPHTPKAASPAIVFNKSRTGLIAYRKGTPLAWIVLGYHQGQLANQPKTVQFVDVAYHRQTPRGISMETAFFDTLQEAKAFVLDTFKIGGAA